MQRNKQASLKAPLRGNPSKTIKIELIGQDSPQKLHLSALLSKVLDQSEPTPAFDAVKALNKLERVLANDLMLQDLQVVPLPHLNSAKRNAKDTIKISFEVKPKTIANSIEESPVQGTLDDLDISCMETMPYSPSPVKMSKSLLSKTPAAGSKSASRFKTQTSSQNAQSYFWSENEHLDFIVNFHKHGRAWKKISEHQEQRDPLQCRTHGQKYLMSLQTLQQQINQILQGQKAPTNSFCQKISKYEGERRQLINYFMPAATAPQQTDSSKRSQRNTALLSMIAMEPASKRKKLYQESEVGEAQQSKSLISTESSQFSKTENQSDPKTSSNDNSDEATVRDPIKTTFFPKYLLQAQQAEQGRPQMEMSFENKLSEIAAAISNEVAYDLSQ